MFKNMFNDFVLFFVLLISVLVNFLIEVIGVFNLCEIFVINLCFRFLSCFRFVMLCIIIKIFCKFFWDLVKIGMYEILKYLVWIWFIVIFNCL